MKKTLMLVTEAERKLIEDSRSNDPAESKASSAEIRAAIESAEQKYRYRCKHCGLGTNCSDLICVGCFAY